MDRHINIQETLDWYLVAGIDEIVGDSPSLATPSPFSVPLASKNVSRQPVVSVVPTSSALKNAKEVCQKASSLDELREIMVHFDGCNLRNTAASTVFGDGNPKAKLMLIGEAPGADEDRVGKPFVGRCGHLLDKMLTTISLDRNNCYITNVLPWRPPGNRAPTDEEIAVCLPFLKRQIELVCPDILLLLGGIALKSVMDCNDSISRTRGKWLSYFLTENKSIQVIATYHPSYLLRSSNQKAKVWADLLRLKQKLKEINQ